MINKYTLKFKDQKMEDKYQEYQNLATRKTLLLQLFYLSFIWNMTDFMQVLILNEIYNIDDQTILTIYFPSFTILTIYLMVYFLKPNYAKWMILIQNHIYAYLYWTQFKWLFQQQATYNTYLLVGVQFISMMSLEFLEIAYQILLFTSVYLAQMMLEAPPIFYCLFTSTILTVFVFLYNYYNHCNKMRQLFKLRFIDNQWEQIFISLSSQGYLIFDFDELNRCFIYRSQLQYDEIIKDTSSLREYLRLAKTKENKQNLEQYIYGQLDAQKNIIKRDLEVLNGIQTHKNYFIQYSIFRGVRPIIVFQHIDKKEGKQMTDELCNSKEVEQSYYTKYLVFMSLAKRLIFTPKNRFMLNFLRFKRFCIFQNYEQYLMKSLKLDKELPLKFIKIEKIINKIIKLYPHIKIIIDNQNVVGSIVNNTQLVSIILIGVLEKILSYEATIKLKGQSEQKISVKIISFFNDKNFQKVSEIVQHYKHLIPKLILDNFSITILISDNDQIESTSRIAQISDFSKDLINSNRKDFNQDLKEILLKKQPQQENYTHQQDQFQSDKT